MIQRIQTVYFLLIIAMLGIMLFIPFGKIISANNVFDFTGCGYQSNEDHLNVSILPICVFISVLMAYNAVIMLLFKNRVLQIKLAKLNGILLAVLIAVMVLSPDYVAEKLNFADQEVSIEYGLGTYLSFFPLIFNYLSIKSIKKDEELVRSADRLR